MSLGDATRRIGRLVLTNFCIDSCALIPEDARDITLRYVLGGFFYVISFVKGDDYDFNWNLEVPLSGGQKLKDYLEQ